MPSYSGVWTLSQQFQGRGQGLWPATPGAPTIGTATASGLSALVAFTAPACAGVPATITGYTATSTPGCITGTGSSSPVTVSGLTDGVSYTFKVKAANAVGSGPCSAASNSITASNSGSQSYTTPGTYSWVAPAGVTSVSVVAVGGGGGGGFVGYGGGAGGGLGYKNNYAVTPGSSYTVVVGAGGAGGARYPSGTQTRGDDSYFVSTSTVKGGGAGRPSATSAGGNYVGDGGGNGGNSSNGAGGAGGYSGTGGSGGSSCGSGAAGAGGGGGGGAGGKIIFVPCVYERYTNSGAGGGVGILGQGSNGAGGVYDGSYCSANNPGTGGSGGATPVATNWAATSATGGAYGGGGGGSYLLYFYCGGCYTTTASGPGGSGAVRIIWPGNTRSFPSTDAGAP